MTFRHCLMRFFTVLFASLSICLAQSSTRWLDVPYVEQVKAGCGSAAVSMVVQYWAQRFTALQSTAADAERIDKLLPAESGKGIHGRALRDYLNQHGFDAFVFNGELSDLRHHVEKGRPVVVCLAPRGPASPLHYAVVVGIDEKSVWLNDSARGKLFSEDLDHFSKEWGSTGNWALLAVPRSPE